MSAAELTIGEVAQRSGLRASAIRYYESVQLLPTPRRVSGQRRYDADILRHLEFIQIAQEAGFTIADIQLLLRGPGANATLAVHWQELAHQKLTEVDALIEKAHRMKRLLEQGLNCGCMNLDDCINCVLINCGGPHHRQKSY